MRVHSLTMGLKLYLITQDPEYVLCKPTYCTCRNYISCSIMPHDARREMLSVVNKSKGKKKETCHNREEKRKASGLKDLGKD